MRAGVPTTSSAGRWALAEDFADLFAPELADDVLDEAVERWQEHRMSPGDRLRIRTAHEREQRSSRVVVRMPDGSERALEPGDASLVLKGVIETWAPARMADPVVLTVSEPGRKVLVADAEVLADLGVSIDVSTLLPDAVIVDIGAIPPRFWVVEAVRQRTVPRRRGNVSTPSWGGPVFTASPSRRAGFLSAFTSRNSAAAAGAG